MHKNLSPSYLKQIFTDTANVLAYNLRNSELNHYIPRPRTEFGKGSLQYRGSVLWNRISPQNFAQLKRLQDLTEWERLLFSDLNMIKSEYDKIRIFIICILCTSLAL